MSTALSQVRRWSCENSKKCVLRSAEILGSFRSKNELYCLCLVAQAPKLCPEHSHAPAKGLSMARGRLAEMR
eukprot:s956_g9.t1